MAGRKHGSRGQMKMDPAGTIPGTPVVVGDISEWTADFDRDEVDVTAFGDTFKQYVMGLPNSGGTFAGWWNSASFPSLFDVVLSAVPVTLVLVPSSDEPTYFLQGLAYLDASINCAANGAVSISGKWRGAGEWTLEPSTLLAARAA